METKRAMQAVIIPVIAFAAVALIAFGFGMFLHVFGHTGATAVALTATLAVTIGAGVVSATSPPGPRH